MSVWGHDVVYIEKDVEKKQWVVSTAGDPPQHLVTIPWVDAFRGYTKAGAPDYVAAIEACQGNETTALTEKEERASRRALAREKEEKETVKDVPVIEDDGKVVDIAQFRKRKR